jgi:hypothetical protein
MSKYIRTLAAVPEAFETLSKKQWGTPTAFPAEERQPDKDEKMNREFAPCTHTKQQAERQ